MELFIAGNESQNQEDWSIWDEVAIIVANSIEEAESLTWNRPVIELDLNKIKEPGIIMQMQEPAWGDDL